jgi:hypothetical protein
MKNGIIGIDLALSNNISVSQIQKTKLGESNETQTPILFGPDNAVGNAV